MWFWSVSWSTNCSVFFSFFLVDQKKIVQSQGIFGQSLGIFGWPKKNLVDQKKFWYTKKKFGRPKIPRDCPKPHGRDYNFNTLTCYSWSFSISPITYLRGWSFSTSYRENMITDFNKMNDNLNKKYTECLDFRLWTDSQTSIINVYFFQLR